jgi:hypothetical protein
MAPRLQLLTLGPLALAGLLLIFLVSCQDTTPSGLDRLGPDGHGPLFHIFHAGSSGGNPLFFFRPPLAPSVDPTGAPNKLLRPYVRICVTKGDDGGANGKKWPDVGWDGCIKDVTKEATGLAEGLKMTHNGDGEYQANWDTEPLLEILDGGDLQSFRIEVWGLPLTTADGKAGEARLDDIGDRRWLFGWRDVTQSPSVASCNQDPTQAICRINYGQTIPVKVWIGEFVFCPYEDQQNCAVQFVDPTEAANLTTGLGGGLEGHLVIPKGAAGEGFALAFEPCTTTELGMVQESVDLPTFNPCLRSVAPPDLPLLDELATISVCTPPGTPVGLKPGQHVQLALHHASTRGRTDGKISSVEAWPHAWNCGEDATSGPGAVVALAAEPEGPSIFRFARELGSRVLAWTNPQPHPLVARAPALRWDVGAGGHGRDLASWFFFALPGTFDGATRQSVAPDSEGKGEIKALVLDLDGVAVENALVTFYQTDENFQNPVVLNTVPVPTNFDGVASILVEGLEVGEEYHFLARGNGIAGPDPDLDTWVCPLVGTLGDVDGELGACNGPREGMVDPFQPLSTGHHFNDPIDGGPVTLTRGAFPITAVTCQTPELDGILSKGEWDCAQEATIQVNLSGGSKVDGRLLWMNDDDNFYLAVEVPGTDHVNSLRIEWHRNMQGPPAGLTEGATFTASRAIGADVWEFHPGGSPEIRDMFIDDQCSGSTQSSCGLDDEVVNPSNGTGVMDTRGAFRNNLGGVTVYEIAHPLSTGDNCFGLRLGSRGCRNFTATNRLPIDLRAAPGDRRAFFVSLRMGSGAQGNTVWPGFLQYLVVDIK